MDTDLFKKDIEKCIEHVREDLSQIRTGRANPELVEEVGIDAYGTVSPLNNLATLSVIDAKTINVQPWDKTVLENIAKGLQEANLGFSVITEGDRVLIKLPDLTEERRQEYVKIMGERVEECRVSVRQVRQKYMKELDELQKEGLSEDEVDRMKEGIEKIVKETNERIEEIRKNKEIELTTI